MIESAGYAATLTRFGALHAALLLLVAGVLRSPGSEPRLGPMLNRMQQTEHNMNPPEVVRTPIFYVLYGMFTMVSGGGRW